jgi:hypothetical protein
MFKSIAMLNTHCNVSVLFWIKLAPFPRQFGPINAVDSIRTADSTTVYKKWVSSITEQTLGYVVRINVCEGHSFILT